MEATAKFAGGGVQKLIGDRDLKFRREVGAGYWLLMIIQSHGNGCGHPERACGQRERQ